MENNLDQLDKIKKEYEEVLEQLAHLEIISDREKIDELLQNKKFLEKIIEKDKEISNLKKTIEENKAIIKSQEDQDLSSLAEIEISQLNEKLKILEDEIENLLVLRQKNQSHNKAENIKAVIIEIRAGTGGQEAALFAGDLFKMYSKYALSQNWQQKILDSKPTELGGFKEIVFELKDSNVWTSIKYEAGVHRVQRIPSTEKSGRIHTSTASVAVLPKPKKGKVNLRPQDLKIDTYKASGPGGQYVNKRMTAIRITHLPTGIIVNSQNERSLQQNKENALSILEARIMKKQTVEEERKIKDKRKTQIGKAERSEKNRTYNYPQNRITDHRIKKSFHNLEQIMEGKLDIIIKALYKKESNN